MVRLILYFTIEKNIIEPRINPGLSLALKLQRRRRFFVSFVLVLRHSKYQDKRKGKTRRVDFLLFHLPFDTSCGLLRVLRTKRILANPIPSESHIIAQVLW